jgi:hypothetical protein
VRVSKRTIVEARDDAVGIGPLAVDTLLLNRHGTRRIGADWQAASNNGKGADCDDAMWFMAGVPLEPSSI